MTGYWRFVFAYAVIIMTVVGLGSCLERCERPRSGPEPQIISPVADPQPRRTDPNFSF